MILRRVSTSGAAAGALVLAVVFAAELIAGVNLQMMGVHDDEVQRKLVARFGRLIALQQASILAAYVVLGAVLGGAASLGGALWDRARARSGSALKRVARGAAGALGVEGWRLAAATIHYPQLFAESLYARGGARRALQVFLTDHAPRVAVEAVGWIALAVLFLGPLATPRGMRWLRGVRARLGPRHAVAATGALALAALVSMPWSCRRALATTPPGPSPNVLILAVDSLRADRVGPGHEAVAPHLAALAARSVRFESAYVTIPRTFPSWTTILSGRWPHHHGIRHMFPSAAERAAAGPFLPRAFADHGYQTAVVSDFSGEIFSRLDAGFAERSVPYFDLKTVVAQAGLNLHPALVPWDASALGHRLARSLEAAPDNADPDRLADQVIDHLRRVAHPGPAGRAAGPFLLTAFFSTPHFPYAAPDPYYRRFAAPGYEGPFRYHKPVAAFGASDSGVDDRDIAQIRALYDGAVAAVDDSIQRILDELERLGVAQNTIVVVLADHGEDLYEDGRGMGHGEHLRGDHMLHIPFLLYDPVHRLPPHAVPGQVRDVDLAPTLAALTGVPFPSGDGVDLSPLLHGSRSSLDLDAFSETGLWLTSAGPIYAPDERLPYPALPDLVTVAPDDDIVLAPQLSRLVVVAKHRALRAGGYKLHYVPTREGVRFSLYDLQRDPDELHDVAAQHPTELAELGQRLYEWMTQDGSAVEAGFVVPR